MQSQLDETNRLLLDAATGAYHLSEAEWARVVTDIAQVGFDPLPRTWVGGRLTGLEWQGRVLRGRDRLTSAEVHFLRHVIYKSEWPPATRFTEYLASISAVILDPTTGLLTSKYDGAWQLTMVRRAHELRGPAGAEWILVDYRVGLGHWVTAYQPAAGLQELQSSRREELRWQRQPH